MFSFSKQERLCSYSRINELFAKGESFFVYPFRVHYLLNKQGMGMNKVLVVCPKRNHKHAVERNLIKRRIREAYRLNNNDLKLLSKQENFDIDFSISYTSKEVLPFQLIEEKVKEVLETLANTVFNSQKV
ncbi:MAG: ribonuclease P protein component [Bacteroidales bacterium]|nr:ribonuclease P protein component [Bacteroidales bacterium]